MFLAVNSQKHKVKWSLKKIAVTKQNKTALSFISLPTTPQTQAWIGGHMHTGTHIWLPSCAAQGRVHQLASVQRKKRLVARKAAFLTLGKWPQVGSLSTGSLCLSSCAISQRLYNTKDVAQLPWVSGSFFKKTEIEMLITIQLIHTECLPSSRHSNKWTRKHNSPSQR